LKYSNQIKLSRIVSSTFL